MTRFCYRKPTFPTHAFVACLMFEYEGSFISMYPLTTMYASLPEFLFDIHILFSTNPQLEESVSDIIIALPVVLQRLWPLKKDYWENLGVEFTPLSRLQQFLGMIGKHEFYTLLATPYVFKKPYTQISAVCPFLSSSSDIMIERFMKSSNYPVPRSASHAALYTFEEDYGINWKTGKVVRKNLMIKNSAVVRDL